MNIVRANTLEEAIKLVDDGYKVLAGGTNIFVDKKKKGLISENFVDISKLDLNYIKEDETGFYIGALVTFDCIEKYFKNKEGYREIYLSAYNMGGPQIRNRATLVGNIVDSSPACDGAPFLLVNDAEIIVKSVDGERKIAVKDFFLAFRKTALKNNEIITSIFIKKQNGTGVFKKVGLRNAMAISVASLAVKSTDGKIRIAVGSLAPTPKRLYKVENYINGCQTVDKLEFESLIDGEISPITDLRANEEYRRTVCKNLLVSALKEVGYEL